MRTTVEFQQSAGPSLGRWLARIANAPGGNAAMADLFLEELQAELVRKLGEPDGMTRNANGSFTWRFNSDTWVRYVIEDRPASLFRSGHRRVIITEVEDRPGA